MLFWPNALWSGPPGSQSRPVVKEPCSPSFLPWSQVLCDAKGHLSAPSWGAEPVPRAGHGVEAKGVLVRVPVDQGLYEHSKHHIDSVADLGQISLLSLYVSSMVQSSEIWGLSSQSPTTPMALTDLPLPFSWTTLPKHLGSAPAPHRARGLNQSPACPLESFSHTCVETSCLRDEAKCRPL